MVTCIDELLKKCWLCGHEHSEDLFKCVFPKTESIQPVKNKVNEKYKEHERLEYLDDVKADSLLSGTRRVRNSTYLVRFRSDNGVELIDKYGNVDHKASFSINRKYTGCQISVDLARNICESIRNYENDIDSIKVNSVKPSSLEILRNSSTSWLDNLRAPVSRTEIDLMSDCLEQLKKRTEYLKK